MDSQFLPPLHHHYHPHTSGFTESVRDIIPPTNINWFIPLGMIAFAALVIACFVATGYISFQGESIPLNALEKGGDNLTVDGVLTAAAHTIPNVSGVSSISNDILFSLFAGTTVGKNGLLNLSQLFVQRSMTPYSTTLVVAQNLKSVFADIPISTNGDDVVTPPSQLAKELVGDTGVFKPFPSSFIDGSNNQYKVFSPATVGDDLNGRAFLVQLFEGDLVADDDTQFIIDTINPHYDRAFTSLSSLIIFTKKCTIRAGNGLHVRTNTTMVDVGGTPTVSGNGFYHKTSAIYITHPNSNNMAKQLTLAGVQDNQSTDATEIGNRNGFILKNNDATKEAVILPGSFICIKGYEFIRLDSAIEANNVFLDITCMFMISDNDADLEVV
jgi:hypothetical protein